MPELKIISSPQPITPAEMVEMFGESMPIEAIKLLWSAPDEKTIGEIRSELREIAKLKKSLVDAWREG